MSRQDVTRRIEPGILEIDLAKSALIINYHIHAEVADAGTVIKSQSEDKQKILPLEVDEDTDVEALADEIVRTQKYVPLAKRPRLLKLLMELQDHVVAKGKKSSSSSRKSSKRDKKSSSKKSSSSSSRRSSTTAKDGGDSSKGDEGKDDGDGAAGAGAKKGLECSMDKLEEYQSQLYEDDHMVRSIWGHATDRVLRCQRLPPRRPLPLRCVRVGGCCRAVCLISFPRYHTTQHNGPLCAACVPFLFACLRRSHSDWDADASSAAFLLLLFCFLGNNNTTSTFCRSSPTGYASCCSWPRTTPRTCRTSSKTRR
jgi:hypothetical protein